jgi:hypothetical protein
LASFGLFAGSAAATMPARASRALLALAAAKLVVHSVWMLFHDEYVDVIADTGIALTGMAALYLWSMAARRDPASVWMLGGVGVSLLAAAVQVSGFAPHRSFNHNDLYHVIQIVAILFFYAGATRL